MQPLRFGRSALIALALSINITASAATDDTPLADLSLEELITLEVTSVAKKPQKPEEAAAAITVITAEDLRRAGVTSLPEALRLAPGVEVAEIDGNITAVTIRGFNWRFSSKLLVLVDGRAIYSPSLTGLFWDQQLVPVENIQRIELVRGPGATMWGANAVNGVINIVTKHAADTQEGLASVEASTHEASRVFGRYGFRLGDTGAVRAYGVQRTTPALADSNGSAYNDGSDAWQAGFRMDLEPTFQDSVTLQGDIQKLEFQTTIDTTLVGEILYAGTQDDQAEGYNLLGRWVHSFSNDHTVTVQGYVDHILRNEFDSEFDVTVYDLDLNHHFKPFDNLDVVWGLNTRKVEDKIEGNFQFEPAEYSYDWFSGFAQVELEAIPERLRFTLGAKVEDNSFTGMETQPSLRAIWLGQSNWALWGAVSKAVRTPSRFERHINSLITAFDPYTEFNQTPLPINVYLVGSSDFDIEKMVAYEIGFRKTFENGAALDLTAYQQDYSELLTPRTSEPVVNFGYPFGPDGPALPVSVDQAVILVNGDGGSISGVEASLTLKPFSGRCKSS